MERTFGIEGMHCASCGKLVEMSLRELPGVEGASVDIVAKRAMIMHDGSVADTMIGAVVNEVGYAAVFDDNN